MNDTHTIPAHDDEDREVCAAEDCDACGGTVTEQFPARNISECAGFCVGVCTCATSYTAAAAMARTAPPLPATEDLGHRAVKRALGKALGIEGDMSWAGLIGIAKSQRAGLNGYRDAAEHAGRRVNQMQAMLPPVGAIILPADRHAAIDEVFGTSSNVVDIEAGPVVAEPCEAVGADGCIRVMAAGYGLLEPGAAAIHLRPDAARYLLARLAEAVGAIVLPEHDPVLIDRDGDRWQVMAWHADNDVTLPISKVRRRYGPITLAEQQDGGQPHG